MKKIILLCTMLLCLARLTFAQNGFTLKQCIDSAEQNNYAIKASKAATEAIKANKGTVLDFGKTTFTLSQDPTSGGSPDNAISIGQSFDFPSLYIAKYKQKGTEASIAEKETAVKQAEIAKTVCQLYAQIQFLQEKSNILARHDSLCDAYLQIATNRQKAGETSNLDVLNARMLKQETALSISENQEQINAASRLMQQYTGMGQDAKIGTGKQEILQTSSLINGAMQAEIANEKLASAQKELSISKQEFLPSFEVSLRWQAVMDGYNPYDVDRSKFDKGDFMGFEVGVGLPLIFAANKSKVKAAKLAISQQEMEQKDIENQMQTAYKNAQSNYELAQKQQMQFQNDATLADDMERISLLSYQHGEINYVEHVANMRAALDNRMKAAESIYNLNLSEIEVSAAQPYMTH